MLSSSVKSSAFYSPARRPHSRIERSRKLSADWTITHSSCLHGNLIARTATENGRSKWIQFPHWMEFDGFVPRRVMSGVVFVYAFGQVIQIMEIHNSFDSFTIRIDECWTGVRLISHTANQFERNRLSDSSYFCLNSDWMRLLFAWDRWIIIDLNSFNYQLINEFIPSPSSFLFHEWIGAIHSLCWQTHNGRDQNASKAERWGQNVHNHPGTVPPGPWTASVHYQLVIHLAVAEVALTNASNSKRRGELLHQWEP